MRLPLQIIGVIIVMFACGFLLAMCQESFAKELTYKMKVVEVLDGDTFKALNPVWPEEFRDVIVRAENLDTPESEFYPDHTNHPRSAKCAAEHELGKDAKAYAVELLPVGETVSVTFDTKDKDARGRLLARVVLPDGRNFSSTMKVGKPLKEGGPIVSLGRDYDGGSKGAYWCK